jgi:hypothetical protein
MPSAQAALALYYTHVGGGTVGEPWDQWSWLQAVGFAIFAAGVYAVSVGDGPCFSQSPKRSGAAGGKPNSMFEV